MLKKWYLVDVSWVGFALAKGGAASVVFSPTLGIGLIKVASYDLYGTREHEGDLRGVEGGHAQIAQLG